MIPLVSLVTSKSLNYLSKPIADLGVQLPFAITIAICHWTNPMLFSKILLFNIDYM